MTTKNILIFGGTGFIGRHLVETLKKKGYHSITVTSRTPAKKPIKNVTYISDVDICNTATYSKFLGNFDTIINLAGLVSFQKKDQKPLLKTNYYGPTILLKECEKQKIKKFIHLSSTASLGFSNHIINEETKFNWKDFRFLNYSYSKHLANSTINKSHIHTNIIYPPLVIGPGDTLNTKKLINHIRNKKHLLAPPGTNGIIDVRDLAQAITLICEQGQNKHNYIVSHQNLSFTNLFTAATNALNQNTKIFTIPKLCSSPIILLAKILESIGLPVSHENIFLGFQHRAFSNDKLKSELNFTPKTPPIQSFQDHLKGQL